MVSPYGQGDPPPGSGGWSDADYPYSYPGDELPGDPAPGTSSGPEDESPTSGEDPVCPPGSQVDE